MHQLSLSPGDHQHRSPFPQRLFESVASHLQATHSSAEPLSTSTGAPLVYIWSNLMSIEREIRREFPKKKSTEKEVREAISEIRSEKRNQKSKEELEIKRGITNQRRNQESEEKSEIRREIRSRQKVRKSFSEIRGIRREIGRSRSTPVAHRTNSRGRG